MSKSKLVFTLFFSLLIPLLANLISPLSSFSQTQTEETLTITTYYPAPYGVYNEMRLFPHTPAGSCDSTKIGTMYYDSAPTENQIKVCTDDGWKNISGDPVGKTLVDFGNAAIYLSDGATISGSCTAPPPNSGNTVTGSARYFNGKIQTRVSHVGYRSCDTGWVDGYSAVCNVSGGGTTEAFATINGLSGYTSLGGIWVGEEFYEQYCQITPVSW